MQATARGQPRVQPTHIGPYRLVRELGRGGMGRVYLARDTRSDVEVAVKQLRAGGLAARGLRREFRTLSRLRHPGVVAVLDHGLDDAVPWYAMELLQGHTLRSRMPGRRRPALTFDPLLDLEEPAPQLGAGSGELPEALSAVGRICLALAFLHGEGVVHRDLKPDNVVFRDRHSPVLVDFGVAAHAAERETIHSDADAKGTVAYMSPEQIRGELVDPRSDLYALGCMLYELVTGQAPFLGRRFQVAAGHLTAVPLPPSELTTCPAPLERLILGLLEKSPGNRPGDALAVAAALRRLDPAIPYPTGAPRPYLYRPPLAGRQRTLERVLLRVDQARQGAGGVVLISGQSGVGKTRLILETVALASGLLHVRGAVHQGSHVALNAWREVLKDAAAVLEDAGLQSPAAAVLARLEPTLARVAGRLPVPALEPEAEQQRLADAVGDLLRSLPGPVLCTLDDVQWADPLSLRALDEIRRAPGQVLVLATARSDVHNSGLQGFPTLALGPLDDPAVCQLTRDMLGGQAPEMLVSTVAQHAAGNPLFAGQTLRAAVDHGLLRRGADGRWHTAGVDLAALERLPLPGDLTLLLTRRLEGLPTAARSVAESIAVLGDQAQEGELPALLELSVDTVARAIDALVAAGLVAEEPPLRFHHTQLAQTVLGAAQDTTLRGLHHNAARLLATRIAPPRSAIAEHHVAADEAGEALTWFLDAANEAERTFALAEAEHNRRRWLAIAEPSIAWLRVGYQLASTLRSRGKWTAHSRSWSSSQPPGSRWDSPARPQRRRALQPRCTDASPAIQRRSRRWTRR
jgi:eukaryotic-like serine/threonine-protein kinase